MIASIYGVSIPDNVKNQYSKLFGQQHLNAKQLMAFKRPLKDNVISRVCAYVKDHPNVLLKVLNITELSGASVNSPNLGDLFLNVFFYSMPFVAGMWTCLNHSFHIAGLPWDSVLERYILPSSFVPNLSRAALAGAICVALVALAIISKNIYNISVSDTYGEWRSFRKVVLKKTSRKLVLTSDAFLINFLCPIKKDIPDCPVRAPNNCTYEKKRIIKWLNTHPGKSRPEGGAIFHENDLVFDIGFANSVLDRINMLVTALSLNEGLKTLPHYDEFIGSYQKKRRKIAKHKNEYETACINTTADKFKTKKISEELYQSEFRSMILNRNLRTVYVCTDNKIVSFLKSLFGIKKTMARIEYVHFDNPIKNLKVVQVCA